MTSVGEVAEKLRGRYVEGLPAKWRVIEEALDAMFQGERGEAEKTLRRLAHQVRGTAASFGLLEIDRAAHRLEYAEDRGALRDAAVELVGELRAAYMSTSLSTVQILLIDDDPSVGFIIKALLVEENLGITQVTSASAAQYELESTEWSMILVDLILPDVDGRTLLTQIRGMPMHRDTPLVVLSGKTSSLVKNECSMYGIDGFIDKPIDPATFAVSVAAVLGRTRSLQAAAYADPLTGLPNRVGFRRGFGPLVASTTRSHKPLSIALLDLDHFKQFNDTYGHHVGDQTLRVTAETLERSLPGALVGRWGGEEFLVALPDIDSLGALLALERTAQVLRDQPIGVGAGVALTFSAGVTQLEADESLDAALLRADQLLYQAKRAGRARCAHVFEPGGEGRPKLLIAEDDPELAALLFRDLVDDYDVTHASDGLTALALASRTNFDVVMLDYQMPGRNGAEVVRTLREWPEYADKPILLLTAVGNDSSVEAAFEAGADDYINKPHSRRSLLARLARHLGRAPRVLGKPSAAAAPASPTEAEVTVLFCDISGFTALASRMQPREVVALLNVYFPIIAEIVVRHGGTLEKYIGDALLAIWGSSEERSDDALRAVQAAVEIQQAVRSLASTTTPPIAVHIGLDSGRVAIGNIGSGSLVQQATIGSATNLASRICDLAGPGRIVLGAATFERLAGARPWPIEGPSLREAKGCEHPLAVYELRVP
ncbi:response regulator [Nannocystaceae bacterium ST9]